MLTYNPNPSITANEEPTAPTGPLSASQWARLALTGDSESTTPTDAQLTPFLSSESRNLKVQYPCLLALDENDTTDQAKQDNAAFAEALGYRVAGRVRNMPLWYTLGLDDTTEIDFAGVTIKPKSMASGDLIGVYASGESLALASISCIANAKKPSLPTPYGTMTTRGLRTRGCCR